MGHEVREGDLSQTRAHAINSSIAALAVSST